jgi:hypothetical protein
MVKSLTPIKAIRARCVDCSAGEFSRVTDCTVPKCALYPYRHGCRPEPRPDIKTPIKTIRARCLQCNGTPQEIKLCQVTNCELFQYRLGRNPRRQGGGQSAEQMAKVREKRAKGFSTPATASSSSEKEGGATYARSDADRAGTPSSPSFANQGGHSSDGMTE